MKYLIGLLFISICCLSCSQQSDQLDTYFGLPFSESILDDYLEQKMAEKHIPGLSFAMINDGEMVYHTVKGFANRALKQAVTKQTMFEAASLSKPVFAHFVMKFVEAGKLDLDRPLYEYLPYPDIAYDDRYKKITARMILSHRSGFPNWRDDYEENKLFIQFDPGTDYSYSGEGYQYLAKVLKHIEGTDWEGLEDRFQEWIAQPFGLEHTMFIQDEYSIANKAAAYDQKGRFINKKMDIDSMKRKQFIAPASVHSEAIDFSKWLIAFMNEEGLSEERYEELLTSHSIAEEMDYFTVDYTLGFFHPQLPFTNVYLHGGNNYGFTAWFAIDPDKDWGFVLFTNSEYGEDLGGELTFYLLFGPHANTVLVVVGIIGIIILVSIFFLIRYVFRRFRAREA